MSWAHFAAFSTLLGMRDDDDSAFDHGTCARSAPGAADQKLGIRDEVNCNYAGSTQIVTVARFESAPLLQTYFGQRVDAGFGELVWTSAGQPRGLTLVSPRDGTGPSSLSSSVCGLPNYLVQVSAPDRSKVDTLALHDDTWNKATFPDAVPPACDASFRAARVRGVATPSVGPHQGRAHDGLHRDRDPRRAQRQQPDRPAGTDVDGRGQHRGRSAGFGDVLDRGRGRPAAAEGAAPTRTRPRWGRRRPTRPARS